MTQAQESHGPGRPRDRGIDDRIREAARSLLAEEGYAAVTVSAVAKRAGLPRSTVYRRHDDQFALRYATLVLPAGGPRPVVDTGDAAADLRAHVAANATPFTSEAGRKLLRAVMADLLHDDHGRRIVTEEQIRPRLDEVAAMIDAARRRGELPERCDPMLSAVAVTGALSYQALVLDQPVDDEFLDRLTTLLFSG